MNHLFTIKEHLQFNHNKTKEQLVNGIYIFPER